MPNPIMSMLRSQSDNNSQQVSSKMDVSLPKVDKNTSFLQFVKMMKGKDAKSIVDTLCANGRMSKAQRDSLYQQAEVKANEIRILLK